MIITILLILLFIRPAMDMFVGYELGTFGFINLNISRLWGFIFIIIAIFHILQNKVNLTSTRIHRVLLIFLFTLLIPLLIFTDNMSLGVERYFRILLWIIAFFVFYDIFRYKTYSKKYSKYIEYMIWMVVFSYIFSFFLYKIFGFTLKPEYYLFGYNRLETQLSFTGFFYTISSFSYSLFSMFLLLLLNYGFYYYSKKKFIFMYVFLFILILMSLVRAPIVAILIISFYTFKSKKIIIYQSIFIITLFFFLVVNPLITEEVIEDRIMDDIQLFESGEGNYNKLGSGRVGMWFAMINFLEDTEVINVVFGSGFDADYKATYKYMYGNIRTVHNDFLQLIGNYGLINLILFIYFLIIIWKEIFKPFKQYLKKEYNKVKGCFLAILFVLFIQGLITTIYMFYIAIALSFLYIHINSLKQLKS